MMMMMMMTSYADIIGMSDHPVHMRTHKYHHQRTNAAFLAVCSGLGGAVDDHQTPRSKLTRDTKHTHCRFGLWPHVVVAIGLRPVGRWARGLAAIDAGWSERIFCNGRPAAHGPQKCVSVLARERARKVHAIDRELRVAEAARKGVNNLDTHLGAEAGARQMPRARSEHAFVCP